MNCGTPRSPDLTTGVEQSGMAQHDYSGRFTGGRRLGGRALRRWKYQMQSTLQVPVGRCRWATRALLSIRATSFPLCLAAALSMTKLEAHVAMPHSSLLGFSSWLAVCGCVAKYLHMDLGASMSAPLHARARQLINSRLRRQQFPKRRRSTEVVRAAPSEARDGPASA
jgi:hypothetical protein